MFLPEIQFCDRKKVSNLLSMLLNDFLTEYTLKMKKNHNLSKEIDAGLNNRVGKIAAKYQKNDSFSIEREGIVQAPTSSLLADLYETLRGLDKIQSLCAFDQAIIDQLKQGEFVELEGTVKQSPLEQVFASFFDLFDKHHGLFANKISRQEIDSYSGLMKSDKVTLIIEPFADVETKFITKIKIDDHNEFADRYEIEGDMKIFGRFHRYHDKDSKIDLFDFLPGKLSFLKNNPNNPFMELPKIFKEIQNSGLSVGDIPDADEIIYELEGPIIELSTIAIYVNE
jgi:hypothetical protein